MRPFSIEQRKFRSHVEQTQTDRSQTNIYQYKKREKKKKKLSRYGIKFIYNKTKIFLSKKFKKMFKFKSIYENIKQFKKFSATLLNECLPTVKLKP